MNQKFKRNDILNVMNNFNIDQNIFSEDELKLFEQGGIPFSDSSDTESMRGSVPMPESASKPSSATSNFRTQQRPQPAEDLKTKYSSIITMLEKQNAYLTAEIKRVQAAHDAEKQRIFSNHRIEQDKLLSEVKQLKAKLAHQDAQMPGIREALAQVRDMLSGLVPESVYLKLRDLNEKDMPLSDWLLVQVWEITYPYKKESEFQKKEIYALREELRQIVDKQSKYVADQDFQQKMLNDKDEDLKRMRLNYENARKALELELLKTNEELALLREKGARFDELNRDYKRLEQEKFLLEEKMGFYDTEKNKDTRSLAGEIYRVQDELRRKNELLVQDKDYLTKENIQLLEKIKRLEDKLDKIEKEYLEAKNQAQEYLFQLLNTKSDAASDYEKRIYKEIQDLKEKQQHELESTKQNLIDIYEKQLQFLKEAKEEIEIRKENLEGQLKERQHSYDQLLIDYRTLQRRIEGDMSELRIQLRLKSEELERVQNIYEETLANLKATRHENEMLREKVNVLKSEYYKCQVDCKEEMTTIKAQLEVAREQLLNYEGIEKEIDEAIVKASNYDVSENPLLNLMGQVPTSNKRRIQQAINLAQRLQAKQRESEDLRKILRDRDQEIEKLRDEVQIQRDVIDKMNQPHSYLISHIEERDREIVKYKQALKKTEQDYQNLKAEYEDLKFKYQQAEEDINRLKIKRQNIQNIQNILMGIATGNQQDIRNNLRNAINEISEALNTQTYMDPQSFQKQGKYQQQQQGQNKQIKYFILGTPPSRDSKGPGWYQKLKNKQSK